MDLLAAFMKVFVSHDKSIEWVEISAEELAEKRSWLMGQFKGYV